jgi:hypothetical protein
VIGYARLALCAGLLVLAACAASPPLAGRTHGGEPAAVQVEAPPDASYDWHGLMPAPFGTLLKESPVALHEVLLFHDEQHGASESDGKDCYTVDGAPPRFVGREPEEYLLCFDHDRLNRIDASVRLGKDEAAPVFARACTSWLKSSVPIPAVGNTCEGRDGKVAFSAHLDPGSDESSASVTMTLSNAAERNAARDAVDTPQHEK